MSGTNTKGPVRLHILPGNGALTPFADRLERVLSRASSACLEVLDLPALDVVVMNVPWAVIPRLGTNGFAYDVHHVTMQIDIAHPHLTAHFDQALTALLSHELHHCARAAIRGSSHSMTYGGALVAEGLACCFEEEMGLPTPFYATECSGAALTRFAAKARRQVRTERHNLPGGSNDWMFGRFGDDADFPYQCGYSTGYRLVRDWLDRVGQTASGAAGVDEDVILADWLSAGHDPFVG